MTIIMRFRDGGVECQQSNYCEIQKNNFVFYTYESTYTIDVDLAELQSIKVDGEVIYEAKEEVE